MKRVLIEFYSGRTPENLISLLKERYDEILFYALKGKNAPTEKEKTYLFNVVEEILNIRPAFRVLSKADILSILNAFPRVLPDQVYEVDITGGNESFIAAAGIWQSREEPGKVFLHQYDIQKGQLLYRYPVTEKKENCFPYYLTVPQILALSGTPPLTAPQYNFSYGPLREEIFRLWAAVKPCLKDWNTFCSLQSRNSSVKEKRINQKPGHKDVFSRVYRRLKEAKIAGNERQVTENGKVYMLYDLFVDRSALFLYDKAGTLLEMYAALAAYEAGVFHDIRVGVTLDWNGIASPHWEPDPRNEVDLILMHENLPVLASCKNTEPSNEFLYEIMTMSRHYGGFFSTPMLFSSRVATSSVRQRAKEMNIILIDGIARMDFQRLTQKIKNLFK
ncbi:MAG: DUF1887 family protein [Clostridia bacterium]|nr:DUF1887 family protein [Clostridia bacterium]